MQVWQKAMDLADAMYTITADFPRSEMFGLTSRMRRAAVSIPSNIAEGRAIGGGRFLHHVRIALGSEAELQTQIELSVRRGFLTAEDGRTALADTAEVGRMLHGLHDALKRSQARIRVAQATGVLLFLHAAGFLG
ncbi:MAG TPA: four helix bundle protein [Vicinamibacterales bacterium]